MSQLSLVPVPRLDKEEEVRVYTVVKTNPKSNDAATTLRGPP